MTLCSIYNSVQSRESQMNMLIYHGPCTTSVITAANLPSVFTNTNHCGLFFSQISLFPKTQSAKDQDCLSVPVPPPIPLKCHVCLLSAGRQWWDDNHVQHDPQGVPGGGRAGTHLWGFQQGHTLLKDAGWKNQHLLWVNCEIWQHFYLFFFFYQTHFHLSSREVNGS